VGLFGLGDSQNNDDKSADCDNQQGGIPIKTRGKKNSDSTAGNSSDGFPVWPSRWVVCDVLYGSRDCCASVFAVFQCRFLIFCRFVEEKRNYMIRA
jgi:hypothetical protein